MFYERLEKVCHEHGMSVAEACQIAGLHRSTHTVWKTGSTPSKRSVAKLANVLCTTVEYLLDGDASDANPEDTVYVNSLLEEVTKMGPEARETLLAVARGLNNQAQAQQLPGVGPSGKVWKQQSLVTTSR